jgi:hypothetical protein
MGSGPRTTWYSVPAMCLVGSGRPLPTCCTRASLHLVQLGYIRRYRDWSNANRPKATNPSATAWTTGVGMGRRLALSAFDCMKIAQKPAENRRGRMPGLTRPPFLVEIASAAPGESLGAWEVCEGSLRWAAGATIGRGREVGLAQRGHIRQLDRVADAGLPMSPWFRMFWMSCCSPTGVQHHKRRLLSTDCSVPARSTLPVGVLATWIAGRRCRWARSSAMDQLLSFAASSRSGGS